MKCFFKKEGFLNEAYEPQTDFIVDALADSVKISREQLRDVIVKCSDFEKSNACEASYKVRSILIEPNNAILKILF